nr:hypothetical protein [Tanacetum cinerariifolium]
DVNSDLNGLSSTGVDNTKTRRPQPRSTTKNDRVPSASKSSRSKNKEAEVEEHHRNLLLSNNNKHISSAYNNIKTDSQEPKVTKPKKVEHHKSLATPKPRKSKLLLRWSSTGKLFDNEGKIVDSNESKSQLDCSDGDNACTSNSLEPKIKRFPNSTSLLDSSKIDSPDVKSKVVCAKCKKCLNSVNHNVCLNRCVNGKKSRGRKHMANVSQNETQKEYRPKVVTGKKFDSAGKLVAPSGFSKHMTGNLKLLINFIWKFLGTVRFGNDHVAAILGFGKFCDSDLEVAFRRNACFVRNLEGVDLLKGDHSTNLYIINLHEMASASPICLRLELHLLSHGCGINDYPT